MERDAAETVRRETCIVGAALQTRQGCQKNIDKTYIKELIHDFLLIDIIRNLQEHNLNLRSCEVCVKFIKGC